jgi:choline dehydrogenase
VNVVDGVRWNTAFAYLDPARGRPSLTVVGGALADRLLIERDRVVGALLVLGRERVEVRAERTVLCAGSYGSPAILLRSGVGDPDELRALGIEPRHALPGVGRNLHDHPAAELVYGGSRELERRTDAFAARRFAPVEQSIAKARSSLAAGPFDLHVYPVGGQTPDGAGFDWRIPVACMEPRSRGRLRLRSADPEALPRLDHGFLADSAGHDLETLVQGLQLVREVAAQPPLCDLLGAELGPSAGAADAQALRQFVRREFVHYYHPVGTCRMGAAGDPEAVVDGRGALLGLDGAWIADCSIMPVVPRANTNVPAVVVGERVARTLLGGER